MTGLSWRLVLIGVYWGMIIGAAPLMVGIIRWLRQRRPREDRGPWQEQLLSRMTSTVENLVNYLVLVTIGGGLLWYGPRAFALYAFMVTVGLIIHFMGRLWKLVKVSHAVTNAKIEVVARKVGVSDADYDAVWAEMREKEPSGWKDVERDFKDLR